MPGICDIFLWPIFLQFHATANIIALLLTFACLFNTLNRTMMIGLSLFLVGYIFLEKRITLSIKRFVKVIGIVTLGILIFFGTVSFVPQVNSLIEKRCMGSGYGFAQVYETAVVVGRFPILYMSSMQIA